MSYLSRAVGATKLLVKAKGPTIMVVTGVVSMGAAVITAGKQTLKVEEVLEKHTPDLEKIAQGEDLQLEGYDKEAARQDRFRVYTRASFDLAKLYAVPGVLFIGGAGLVFGGHNIMVKRNATLALAFTGLKSSFDAYRARVVETIGHDADQAFMHGAKMTTIKDAKGKEHEVASRDWDESRKDPYNRVFEQGATAEWQDDLTCNQIFIESQRRNAQRLLNHQNYLYLSDVYASLGFPESDISRVVGWKVERLPDGTKNIPTIDFGLDKPMPDDWKYNAENAIYLDFNCQGLIVGGKIQKIIEGSS